MFTVKSLERVLPYEGAFINANLITAERATPLIDSMVGDNLHAERIQSVTNAVVGVVNAATLSIFAIGAGLAQTTGGHATHDQATTAHSTGRTGSARRAVRGTERILPRRLVPLLRCAHRAS
jgi:hypothetical protein